jgi:ABC-2 type transport system permease protein
MSFRRTLAFTRRILLQFRHDRRTLAFVLVVPLLMMLIFGYTFGGEPKGLHIAVVNLDEKIQIIGQDESLSIAELVVHNLDDETFSISYYDTFEEAEEALQDTEVWAVFYFPANFSNNLFERFSIGGNQDISSQIVLSLDGTNPNVDTTIVKELQSALKETNNQIRDIFNLPSHPDAISIESQYEYTDAEDVRFIDYFAPGVICFAIMMVTIMITILIFINERRQGTLQRLLTSPASETEIVLGYSLAFAVIGIIQCIVILLTAIIIFGITIVGNVFLAFVVVILLAIGHQGLGILLSSAAKNELQAVQFIPLIIFPAILLSGLFWPVESIPSFLQPISYFIPLKYGIDAERAIMLKGWGLGEVWFEIVILVIFAILTLSLSVILLKKRK